MKTEEVNQLVVVYGTLRQGNGNHRILEDEGAEYLGTQKLKPEWTMRSLGGFPGVFQNGKTAITVEVYRVTSPRVLARLNSLEGHHSRGSDRNFYDTVDVQTEWGEGLMYILHEARERASSLSLIESGDWMEHMQTRRSVYR